MVIMLEYLCEERFFSLDQSLKKHAAEQGIVLESREKIAADAVRLVVQEHAYTSHEIKLNFDLLLQQTEEKAYEIYLDYQRVYGQKVLRLLASEVVAQADENHTFLDLCGQQFERLDEFYLSLSQSRKTRAGKTFETIHEFLFRELNYPFSHQPVINGKPDFILPSIEHYRRNPMDCIVFTAKRTLRERWRQIVTEGSRGLGFFLATIDKKISRQQLDDMLQHRIYVVCPEEIRERYYFGINNVLSFSQFFRDHVDPAVARWKANGFI